MLILVALNLMTALSGPQNEHFTVSLGDENAEKSFACLIEYPSDPTDRAVVLFSGGLVADLDWTTPGKVEHLGETIQLTIDGNDVRDGASIASALLDAGFIVVRYSSICDGQGVGTATPIPFELTSKLAHRVWEQSIERTGLDQSRIGVLGHSLGAFRGVQASRGGAGGYVLLAGAYLTPSATNPSALAAKFEKEIDGETDYEDYDGSTKITGWERAAFNAIATSSYRSSDTFTSQQIQYAWPCDLLMNTDAPVCAIWGGLDPTSYHGPVLDHLLGEQLETVYRADLGHQLSDEHENMVAPIDDEVIRVLVNQMARMIPAKDAKD